MKYIIPLIMSLFTLTLPFLGDKSISWAVVALILGYFWVGVVLGEEVGRGK